MLVLTFILAASPVLKLTPETLAKYDQCGSLLHPDESRVKDCGYDSWAQYEAFDVRLQVANAEAIDRRLLKRLPNGTDAEVKRIHAAVDDGKGSRSDREIADAAGDLMRKPWAYAKARQERLRKAPPKELDATAFIRDFDEAEYVAMLDDEVKAGTLKPEDRARKLAKYRADRQHVFDVAKGQPPLSEAEIALAEARLP